MKHSEFKPHAFITLSNFGGIEIMLNRSNDGLFYRFNYGQDNLEDEFIYEAKIDYELNNETGEDGEAGFWHDNTGNEPSVFYPLSSAIRTNI
jgi:hypothetical protein